MRKATREKNQRVSTESEVLNFLTKLATEPEALSTLLRDPEAMMEQEGLDERARGALSSGDPLRVHRSISANAAADNELSEQSMAKARQVAEIVSSDPAVARWLQNYYCQSLMMWLASRSGTTPTPAMNHAEADDAIRPQAAAPEV